MFLELQYMIKENLGIDDDHSLYSLVKIVRG